MFGVHFGWPCIHLQLMTREAPKGRFRYTTEPFSESKSYVRYGAAQARRRGLEDSRRSKEEAETHPAGVPSPSQDAKVGTVRPGLASSEPLASVQARL